MSDIPILEKKLIESVNGNNLESGSINNNSDVLDPALLLSTSMGYIDIVKELIWIKDNKGCKLGIHKGLNRTDIINALNIARINRENASDKKIWIDIVYNLGWALIQLEEDRKRK